MKRASKKWLAVSVAVVLVLAGAAYAGTWAWFEGNDVSRGTLSYFLGVPTSVKRLPIVDECSAPKYRWRGRDGESPPFVSVDYSSRSGAEEILRAYRTSLKQAACTSVKTEVSGPRTLTEFQCQNPDILSASLWIGSESPCASVELNIVENY